jgi:hypothetical protein
MGGGPAYAYMIESVADLPDLDQHLTTHKFGNALYEVEGLDGVAICDHHYGQGCFHQFFMSALLDLGESVVQAFSKACDEEHQGGPSIRACNHGLGHGVMVAFEDRGIEGALAACRTIEEEQAFWGCIDGVFMEYFTPTHTGRDATDIPKREFDRRAPYEPCMHLDVAYQPTCYYMQSSWWVFKKVGYPETAALCRGIPDPYGNVCFKAIGHVLAFSSQYSKKKTIAKCQAITQNTEEELNCRAGAHWAFSRTKEIGITLTEEEMSLCDFESTALSAQCRAESNMIATPIGISVICCDNNI